MCHYAFDKKYDPKIIKENENEINKQRKGLSNRFLG